MFWADEMLKAVAEEALRGLVRSIDHTSIYELRASAADQLIVVLNRTVCLLFFWALMSFLCAHMLLLLNSSRSLGCCL